MSLSPEHLRTMDAVRTRLHQLSETLSLIMRELMERDPLPSWPQMENLQSALSFALSQLNDTMTLNEQTLKEAHVYPLTNFPGHKEGDLMFTLLRKKLELKGEEWIEEFTGEHERNSTNGDSGLGREVFPDLWIWARGCSQGIVTPMVENDDFNDDFTLAERDSGAENVRTGLRRKLWEEESGDEDGDGNGDETMGEDAMPQKAEEVEEGVDIQLPPLPLEGVLRFMMTGTIPTRPPQR